MTNGVGIRQRRTTTAAPRPALRLRAGELVEVCSQHEILATLDENGSLDALPFMPEMLPYCGKRVRVVKRADKTCDTIAKTGGRRMLNAVHLEGLRCDGDAHGGCQAGCLFFWKEAWLKRVGPAETDAPRGASRRQIACDVPRLQAATRAGVGQGAEQFVCQTTELLNATRPLAWWDVRQYVRDIRSGNVGTLELARGISVRAALNLLAGIRNLPGAYRLTRAITSRGAGLWQIPRIEGQVKTGPTPKHTLGLKPGDRVRVKSKDAIEKTLNTIGKNRGLWFDMEMVKYCGGEFTVLRRVERIIEERSGAMLTLPNDCIMLESVVCCGHFTEKRLFCPRMMPQYWREAWLERVDSA